MHVFRACCHPGCRDTAGVQMAGGSPLVKKGQTWEVPPANIGTLTPTENHPDILNKLYPAYRVCKTELYLSELVIYENKLNEIYLEFLAPIWTASSHQMAKITSWRTCSMNRKHSVSSASKRKLWQTSLKMFLEYASMTFNLMVMFHASWFYFC